MTADDPMIDVVRRLNSAVQDAKRKRERLTELQAQRTVETRKQQEDLYHDIADAYMEVLPSGLTFEVPNMHPRQAELYRRFNLKLKVAYGLLMLTAVYLVCWVSGLILASYMPAVGLLGASILATVGACLLWHAHADMHELAWPKLRIVTQKSVHKWTTQAPKNMLYQDVVDAVPLESWREAWQNAASEYMQRQIEETPMDDLPEVLKALDEPTPESRAHAEFLRGMAAAKSSGMFRARSR